MWLRINSSLVAHLSTIYNQQVLSSELLIASTRSISWRRALRLQTKTPSSVDW